VGLDEFPKDPPVPLTTLQLPVPTDGEFAPNVVDVRPHIAAPVLSAPAFAVVGLRLNVMITSSVEGVQLPLEIVQRNV
jgi:hypothetical protein